MVLLLSLHKKIKNKSKQITILKTKYQIEIIYNQDKKAIVQIIYITILLTFTIYLILETSYKLSFLLPYNIYPTSHQTLFSFVSQNIQHRQSYTVDA